MNQYLYYILLGLCIYLTIRNFRMIKRNKVDKAYVECYKKVISQDEDALEYTNNYLETETNPALKNKALVMKLIQELNDGLDYSKTLEEININDILCINGSYNHSCFENNTDVFLWIMTAMAKANSLDKKEVVDSLYLKLSVYPELENKVEYKLVESLYGIFNKTGNTEFISGFLIGEYEGYVADKKVIALDKRFAEAIKAYANEELDEVSLGDIPHFAKTALGEFFMKDLGIYDKYSEVKEESYLEETDKEEE